MQADFVRFLASNINSSANENFYGKIAKNADITSEDVQKYLLSIGDFAKCIQDHIN